MSKEKLDPDIWAIKIASKGLDRSTSRRMLEANLRFLWDRYIVHPSPYIPTKLKV